jgi:hypothetical protein
MDRVAASTAQRMDMGYEVMCLYGDRDEPLALGDIEAAEPICAACEATGIFRADED